MGKGMDVRSDGIGDDVRGVVDFSELALLEFWFEGEVKCESSHVVAECSGCSGPVVGVKRTLCDGSMFRICRSSFEWNVSRIAAGDTVCSGCGCSVVECWRVVPV